jgi:hypothetical protein
MNHSTFRQMIAARESSRDSSTCTTMQPLRGMREADSLLILGPGEAKGERTKRLERHHFSGRIVGSETVDKMTPRQIAAKVRQYFQDKSGRHEE